MNAIRFPRAYAAVIRNLQVDLLPSHFYDILVLFFVGCAFLSSVLTVGGISLTDSVMAPRLLAAAAGLHIFGQVSRSVTGIRIRWLGALFLPFALWLALDSRLTSPAVWRGNEQAAVAVTAALAFWITLHHLRHPALKWFIFGGMGLVASIFGMLVINADHNLLPRLAHRMVSPVYLGQATGPFATPGEYGAFLLICGFPCAAVLVSPALRYRRRIAAGYVVILSFVGLSCAHHAPSWYGFVAGGALLSLLLIESRRLACFAAVAVCGLAFFVPKVGNLNSGLFRTESNKAPLADAALAMLQSHPVTGVGSGGFPLAFESARPWGFNLDPQTAGGFFHQLAAENGAIGILLLAVPAVLLWLLAFRLCWKTPVRLTRLDRQFDNKKAYVPEPRIAMAGVLAGTLAATVTLAMDYARPSVALAIAFAICGAVAMREVSGKWLSTTFEPDPKPRVRLRFALAAIPVLVFGLVIFPVFESAAQARRAEDILLKVNEGGKVTGNAMITSGNRKAALLVAQRAAEDALRTMPNNARAAAVLSGIHASRYRVTGEPAGLGYCRKYAEMAHSLSGGEPSLSLPLLAAYGIYGDTAKNDATLAGLRKIAPHNTPLALEQARRHIADGQPKLATPIIDEVLSHERWNPEAKRLRTLTDMSPGVSAK
jgi:hypothetical protein